MQCWLAAWLLRAELVWAEEAETSETKSTDLILTYSTTTTSVLTMTMKLKRKVLMNLFLLLSHVIQREVSLPWYGNLNLQTHHHHAQRAFHYNAAAHRFIDPDTILLCRVFFCCWFSNGVIQWVNRSIYSTLSTVYQVQSNGPQQSFSISPSTYS